MSLALRRNAVIGTLEVIVYAGVLLLLYRIIVRVLGIEAMGIWSLVMATASFLRFADTGVGAGVGRFVALSRAEGEDGQALRIIDTALVFNAVLLAGLTFLILFPARALLPSIFDDPKSLAAARELLPLAFGAFILGNLSGVSSASLVALHRLDLKSYIVMGSCLLQLAVAGLLIDDYGLVAVAAGQIAQQATILVACYLAARRVIGVPVARFVPRPSRAALRELLPFGLKLQGVSLLTSMFDPISRFVMSAFGGLAAVGTLELAQRALMQLRQLIANPAQQLMPAFAHYKDRASRKNLYMKSMAALTVSAVLILGGAALVAPLWGWLWLGKVPPHFWEFTAILAVGWIANVAAVPAYHLSVSTGRLKSIAIGGSATTVLGPLLAVVLGHELGDRGVVLGTALGLGIGGVIIMIVTSRENGLPLIGSLREWRSGLRSVAIRR
jgi:O-antigen/teichoic acid export membrane protein